MAENLAHELQKIVRSLYGEIADFPLLELHTNTEAPQVARADLAAYENSIRFCKECDLHIGRSKLVFGRGSLEASVVFVGDFPSDGDDAAGKIFADPAGDLLRKMIVAMKLNPDSVYLVNLFQCRPPSNSQPTEKEQKICNKHFLHQMESLRAKHIVALGEYSSRTLTRTDSPLASLRRQSFEFLGARLQCTYHPRELLLDPSKKKPAWEDLQAVMRAMGNI
jgi:uracil-DNA glycosylase family 4